MSNRRHTLCAVVLAAALAGAAHAQEHHGRHHTSYQNWVNRNDKGCCNNQECGELREENERVTAAGVEVKVEGKWCPVLAWHYLKRGTSPDWSSSHVCVMREYVVGMDVCQRLVCYQPKPGT